MENQKRAIDLAVQAGRKRQSPRTGFVHLFSEENVSDTIPLFENFCFAMALFRQRTVESILEGKELVDRLLAFQIPEGNFPVYLHEFPKCYDRWMCLRIAPVLVQIQRHFGTVIGVELKEKMAEAIARLMNFAEKALLTSSARISAERETPDAASVAETTRRSSLWEHRFHKLQGLQADFSPATQEEWFQWVVSEQLVLDSLSSLETIPYHPVLQAFIGGAEVQEKGEPRPFAIEWALSEKQGFSDRLLRDHPAMLHSALLFPLSVLQSGSSSPFVLIPERVRLLWKGSKLHSFSAPAGQMREPGKIWFDLSQPVVLEKGDLIEAAAFCDISPETELTIGGKKGTVFRLGDSIQIRTPSLTIELRFDLVEGQGDFSGQISRANRPGQTACKGALLYEAFDWRIAVRTLRRSQNCLIVASMTIG